ncbi:MAG: EamA family transporter [Bacteroidales bacterium]|nr:EamA family transporter [Bacteroidales bacterium]
MQAKVDTNYLKIVIAAIIWGSSGAFVKYLGLPAPLISFFRLGLPTLFLGIYFLARRQPVFRNNMRLLLIASVINAVRLLFYFIGFLNAPIGNAIMILYTWPVFAVIFSHIFLKEPLPGLNKLLLVVALAGIVLIYSDKPVGLDNDVFWGMSAMLLSALLYSSTVIIFKKESLKYDHLQIVFFQNLVGAVLFLPFFVLGFDALTLHKASVASLYAFAVGIVGFGLFFFSLRRIPASNASFLAYIEVPSAVLFGVFLFHETLTWNEIVGGVMIIGASVMLKK